MYLGSLIPPQRYISNDWISNNQKITSGVSNYHHNDKPSPNNKWQISFLTNQLSINMGYIKNVTCLVVIGSTRKEQARFYTTSTNRFGWWHNEKQESLLPAGAWNCIPLTRWNRCCWMAAKVLSISIHISYGKLDSSWSSLSFSRYWVQSAMNICSMLPSRYISFCVTKGIEEPNKWTCLGVLRCKPLRRRRGQLALHCWTAQDVPWPTGRSPPNATNTSLDNHGLASGATAYHWPLV